MGFIDTIKARAKADKKTIVLPESEDRRTYEAAAQILKEDLANLIIIGSEEAVKKGSEGLDVSKATIVDPEKNEKTQAYVDKLVELRAKKGMTPEKARETILNDYTYYGVMRCRRTCFRCLPFYRKHLTSMPADLKDQTRNKTRIRILPDGSSGLRVRR